MHIEVKGLILRTVDLGEVDRLITVYTRERGLITAIVKGVRSLKNRNMYATQLFCYTSMVLYCKGDKFWVKESELIESFFDIRKTIEGMSLSSYILEVLLDVGTANPEEPLLRLALNSLYAIGEGKVSLQKIKAAFEIRCMAIIGYMPDVLGCRDCGEKYGEFILDIMNGNIQCYSCKEKAQGVMTPDEYNEHESTIIRVLTEGAKIAMCYCIYSPVERLFSFKISDEDMKIFADATEDYLVNHLERSFKSLEFYKEVAN
jgi:DNA repair protein RecO (recombination protein O)